jgi:hypothetical protein
MIRKTTIEAYGAIRRRPAPAKPAPAKAGGGGEAIERNAILRCFDIAQHRL